MKAILDIPEKEIKFEFDNLTFNQYRMIGRKSNEVNPMFWESFPVGKPITLITSNMPDGLRDEIIKLVSDYCWH